MPHATPITVTPLTHSSGFGATVEGIDLNDLSPSAFSTLERSLYTHKLLVIKGQSSLLPSSQLALVQRFDPSAKPVHGHGNAAQANALHKGKKSLVGANPPVPDEPMVRLIGRAKVQPGHYGVTEEIALKSGSHKGFHKGPLTDDEINAGNTRFQRWHIDAAFYRTHPPKVTSLWAHTLPSGPNLTAHFSDESGTTMEVPPGLTAFIDSTQMYERLSEEEKAWVAHSSVEYAPSPYQWIQDAKAIGNGFGLATEGLETPYDELPSNEPELIMRYPLLWTNPLDGSKALQVHAIIATKLFLKSSADGAETIITDLAEIRDKLYKLQRPFLQPENILFPPQEEGDLLLWWNRGLRHTALEYPDGDPRYGSRICHQVHIAGSDNPATPVMVQQEA